MLENKTNKTLRLWFDVGIERYNVINPLGDWTGLWFDVGIERYNHTLHGADGELVVV